MGPSAKKSLALLSVSWQPSRFLVADRRFDNVGVGPEPSKHAAPLPYPTKSIIEPPLGHGPLNADVVLVRATRAVFAPIATAPVASAVGNDVVPPAPAPSCTKKYP